MTVAWSAYAQSLTDRPMKGMLTGPVTIMAWSFVRDDQPRADTCLQIALAIRDEVLDLEKAGLGVIQIDEPALREGLPLKKVRGGVGHVHDLQREMTRAGLTSDIKAPVLYPDYGKFDLREHAGLQEQQS